MGAELLRGQSHSFTGTRLEVRVTAGAAVAGGVILDGVAAGTGLALAAGPALPGVRVPGCPGNLQRITLDLDAPAAGTTLDGTRFTVLFTHPDPTGSGERDAGPEREAVAAPRVTVLGPRGKELAAFTLTGVARACAVAALEFSRCDGAWRVRALGRGYADLSRLLDDYGVPAAARPAQADRAAPVTAALPAQRDAEPSVPPPVSAPADRPDPGDPVAGDAPGWTMEERLFNQVGGMFEDLARRIAAYRGAVDFAESRLERELDALLADPASRLGPQAEAARERAQARRDELADQARTHLDHDLRQLTAESQVVEPALPPPYAGWESPVWHGYRAPATAPLAVRLGDIHLPEVPELRIPMLARLPLERGLWIDSGTEYGVEPGAVTPDDADLVRRRAAEVGAALAARLLAAHPVGGLTVHLLDPTGAAAGAFAPLKRSRALRDWSDTGADGVPGALEAMTRRVDLVTMALRAGVPDALPPDLDTTVQLVVVSGFPYDFDDRALTRLRYLADEGPAAGVHLMLIADRADAKAFGPLLDPLWRSMLRLTPLPDDHLIDPWVGQEWTYEPSLPPEGSRVLDAVLGEIAEARQAHGS